jgi:hypothetical protein
MRLLGSPARLDGAPHHLREGCSLRTPGLSGAQALRRRQPANSLAIPRERREYPGLSASLQRRAFWPCLFGERRCSGTSIGSLTPVVSSLAAVGASRAAERTLTPAGWCGAGDEDGMDGRLEPPAQVGGQAEQRRVALAAVDTDYKDAGARQRQDATRWHHHDRARRLAHQLARRSSRT